MRFNLIATGLTLALILSGSGPLRTDTNLPGELTDEYRPAAEKLHACYLHTTVFGTLKHELPKEHKRLEQHFVYRAAAAHMRLDATTVAEQLMDHEVGSTDISLATPDASLLAYRGANSPEFDNAWEKTYREAEGHIETVCPLHFVYALDLQGTLFERLQKPEVTDVRFHRLTGEQHGLVKVEFQETATHDGVHGEWKCSVLLSPSHEWALQRYVRTHGHEGNETRFQVDVAYEGTQDGLPLVKRIECRRQNGGHECVERREVRVDHCLPGAASQYYFTAPSL